jgi:hypothetical protein
MPIKYILFGDWVVVDIFRADISFLEKKVIVECILYYIGINR